MALLGLLFAACGGAGDATVTGADQTQETHDDAGVEPDNHVLRYGNVVGDSLWFAGGISGSAFAWEPIASVTRTDAEGRLLEEFAIDIPSGRFFEATWIGQFRDEVVVVGAFCLLPLENPHCPVTDTSGTAALIRIGNDVQVTEFPELRVTSEAGLEYRLPEVAGVVDGVLVASIGANTRVDTSLSQTSAVTTFAISLDDGSAAPVPPLVGLASTGALCVSGDGLLGLTAEGTAGQDRPAQLTVHRLDLTGDGDARAWAPVVHIEGAISGPANFSLKCTPAGDVYVAELGPLEATLVRVMVGDSVSEGEPVRVVGQVHAVETTEAGLLITTFSERGIEVQELADSRLVGLVGPYNYPPGDARVVRLGQQLVDVEPAFRLDPSQPDATSTVTP